MIHGGVAPERARRGGLIKASGIFAPKAFSVKNQSFYLPVSSLAMAESEVASPASD